MAQTFSEAFHRTVEQFARDELVQTHLWANGELFTPPTKEQRDAAEAWADKVHAAGKTMDVLEALTPKPCEHCGR